MFGEPGIGAARGAEELLHCGAQLRPRKSLPHGDERDVAEIVCELVEPVPGLLETNLVLTPELPPSVPFALHSKVFGFGRRLDATQDEQQEVDCLRALLRKFHPRESVCVTRLSE